MAWREKGDGKKDKAPKPDAPQVRRRMRFFSVLQGRETKRRRKTGDGKERAMNIHSFLLLLLLLFFLLIANFLSFPKKSSG